MAAVMSAAPVMRQAEWASGATPAFRSGHDSGGQRSTVQRSAMRVSSPTDAAEREASDVARRVVQMPAPAVHRMAASSSASASSANSAATAHRIVARSQISREGNGAGGSVGPATAARIQASRGGGQGLSVPLRRFMEPRFGADFSQVRIHTDARAQQLARSLSARAFTTGGDIFFGAGQYQPDTTEGRELIAHELTHTIQQGAASRRTGGSAQRAVHGDIQRDIQPGHIAESITAQPSGLVQRLGLSDILDGLADLAANVPGYTLLTLVIGRNPINMRTVERNTVNLLRAFIGLIPGGELLFQVLQRQGIVERIATWVDAQTTALGLNFQTVRDAFTRFTDSLGWSDIFSPGDVWRRAQAIFTPIISRVTGFVGGLITQAITWLKETFMAPLSDFCRQIPGYGLVTVLLGRDPFTNAPVPRTAMTVVRAFAEFIPGGTEKVDQLVQSGALDRAYAWFQQETSARNLTWDRVTGTFSTAWASLQLSDVMHPIDTITRIVGMFRPLMTDLVGFAGAALMKLLELIYEAAMGAGGRRILNILMRARATFVTIIQNPVGFLRNLMGAIGQGIRQFMGNILTHLRDGVIRWLTGPVAAAGVQMPERWDARGIIWFVLQIMGLTWDRVRGKLVRLIGEPAMAMLERGFQLIQDIRERGLVQALRDRVTEFFGNLRESALGAIRGFIQQRLVQAGIQQLLSLLSPVGAIVQAIIKTYTTIQFFVQKINQILDLVESIVDSIAAIASGAISSAANFVERTMARTIPVILDFLARFIGLGDVGAQVQTTIRNLQGAVDRMLDRAVEWIRTQATRIGSAVASGARRVAGALRNWWQARKEFTTRDGHPHTLSYRGERAGARLYFASDNPQPIETYLQTKRTEANGNATALRPINEAEAILRQIAPITRATVATGAEAEQVTGKLDELALKLQQIEGAGGSVPARFNVTPGGYGSRDVTLLTRANATGGTTPSVEPAWYQYLQGQGLTDNSAPDKWVRMHLQSEQVGGPGAEANNLIPAPNSVNRGPRVGSFERAVYQLARPTPSGSTSATVIWMEARASGQRTVADAPAGYNAAWFFQSVTLKAGLHYAQDGQWRKDPTARVIENAVPIPAPQFTFGPPTLRSPSETRLSRIDGGLFTSTVVNYMKSAAARVSFTTFLGFERAVRADVPASSWDRLWKPEGGGGIIDRIKAHVDAGTIRI